MKYKTDKGIQVELSDADIMQISKHNKSDFNGNKLNEYFHQMKDEAVKKLEHISNKMIVDEKDVYTNLAYVLKKRHIKRCCRLH